MCVDVYNHNNMPLHRMLKRLLWILCTCSIFAALMLGFELGMHTVRTIPQRNPVEIMATRNESNVVSRNQIDRVTTYQGVMASRNHSSNFISNHSSNVYISTENPSTYLQSERFDLIVKMVYAYFYVYKNKVPKVYTEAYIEHIRVWNNFSENCDGMIKSWFDGNRPCRNKRNKSDFISSFHRTIKNIKMKGFNSSVSRIPLDKHGFLLNGAHRVAAAVILSQNVSFEHHNYTHKGHSKDWGYKFFKRRGMPQRALNVVMLEWMKIQTKLPDLNTSVSVVSIFSNNRDKDKAMRKIVKERCSKDNGILYEIRINFTKSGMRQLITHMYGQQTWLETTIQKLLSKFNSTSHVVFLFIYAKSYSDLAQCKNEIRKLYNDMILESTAHISDTKEENLILAEMILNPNSIQFMNYAKNAPDCKLIAKEVASRSFIAPIRALPGIFLGRDDVMIDSGTVLGLFGLRKRTDVDLLFLHDIDKSLLGKQDGITIQAHAFKNNSISKERAWGEDHFSDIGRKNQWDLFYDPNNFGYCYGIKFVSLKQLVRYKTKRNEQKRDKTDSKLINRFLKVTR